MQAYIDVSVVRAKSHVSVCLEVQPTLVGIQSCAVTNGTVLSGYDGNPQAYCREELQGMANGIATRSVGEQNYHTLYEPQVFRVVAGLLRIPQVSCGLASVSPIARTVIQEPGITFVHNVGSS